MGFSLNQIWVPVVWVGMMAIVLLWVSSATRKGKK